MKDRRQLRLVVVMTDESIVGREILESCRLKDLAIAAVIVEKSERAEREKSYLRNDFYAPPAFAEIMRGSQAEVICVPKINGEESWAAIARIAPDLLLLDGSAIIKEKIFSLASLGALNAHPGLLPEYRGVDSVRWSIYRGDPVGATCHFIDSGIDTGPILLREAVPYARGETLLTIRVRVMRVCARLMIDSVIGLSSGALEAIPQSEEGNYFTWAPPEVQEAVEQKLRKR